MAPTIALTKAHTIISLCEKVNSIADLKKRRIISDFIVSEILKEEEEPGVVNEVAKVCCGSYEMTCALISNLHSFPDKLASLDEEVLNDPLFRIMELMLCHGRSARKDTRSVPELIAELESTSSRRAPGTMEWALRIVEGGLSNGQEEHDLASVYDRYPDAKRSRMMSDSDGESESLGSDDTEEDTDDSEVMSFIDGDDDYDEDDEDDEDVEDDEDDEDDEDE